MRATTRQRLMIAVTMLLALLASIFPLPDLLAPYRPQWVALVVSFWAMVMPQRVSIGTAVFMGLLLDSVNGALFGQHALGLALIAYVIGKFYQRLILFSAWQQALWIFTLFFMVQIFYLWVQSFAGGVPNLWQYFMPCVTSALLWGLVMPAIPLQRTRRHN